MNPLMLLRNELRSIIAVRPAVYMPLARMMGRPFLVEREVDLVIGAYPRSANTFAEAAFRVSQPSTIKLAHHRHAAAQVIRAVEYRLPTVVVFRDPDDAISSLLQLRAGRTTAAQATREYVRFYCSVLPYKGGFVLARFETVTQDFGCVIGLVNERFNRSFRRFGSSSEEVAQAFKMVDCLTFQRRGARTSEYSPDQDPDKLARRRRERALLKEIVMSQRGRAYERAQRVFRDMRAVADC